MSEVHRACVHGPVLVDVDLIEEIGALTAIDCAPSPGVVAPLAARVHACYDAWRNPEFDEQLQADIREAMDGCWMYLEEVHAVQRLRGWHRARYGRVTVDAFWLARVRNVLDSLTLSLESTCEQEVREVEYDPGLHARLKASIAATGFCDECEWCRALRFRDECDDVLDAAGFDGGSRFRAYRSTAPKPVWVTVPIRTGQESEQP